MPRRNLFQTAGVVFHALNRAARRLKLFEDASAYAAFLRALEEGRSRTGIRLLTYCVMPNHFHLVVWPDADGQLTEFMRWFQLTHSKRWVKARDLCGIGAVYQGRFRAFAVQNDSHFLAVCRYVERNPLRAGLVSRAEDWPWSGLGQRCRYFDGPNLTAWPIPQPPSWLRMVNGDDQPGELKGIREALRLNAPFGSDAWAESAARQGLGSMKRMGRPRHLPSASELPI